MYSFINNRRISQLTCNTICKEFKTHFSSKQYKVTPFCQINIDGPFNINIHPLDVFEYKDCDEVIIKGRNKVIQEGDIIKVISEDSQIENCNITAPVKASKTVCFIAMSIDDFFSKLNFFHLKMKDLSKYSFCSSTVIFLFKS